MSATVDLSSVVNDVWVHDLTDFAVWRYVAFANGVFRFFPGTSLDKQFDPVQTHWCVLVVCTSFCLI